MDALDSVNLVRSGPSAKAAETFPLDAVALREEYTSRVLAEDPAVLKAAGDGYLSTTHALLADGAPAPWGTVPMLYSERDLSHLAWIAETMGHIMDKLTCAYLDDAEVRRAFNLPEPLDALVRAPVPYGQLIPIARVDVFLDEATGAFQFCELNTDGSAGMLLNTEVTRALAATAPFASFAARHGVRAVDVCEACAEALLACYRKAGGTAVRPEVVAVDYAESVFMGEIRAFEAVFERLGASLRFADVRELTYEDGVLRDSRGVIDCVWHRVVTGELLEKPCTGAEALMACAREGRVPIVGAMRTWPCATKTAFAVLHSEIVERFLDAEELAFVRAHVPYTEVLSAETDLSRFAEKDAWILKPADGYAGRGVVAGADVDDGRWRELLHETAAERGIVQAYARLYAIPLPVVEGESMRTVQANAMQGLYLFNGKFGGVFTRAGAARVIDYASSRYNLGCLVVTD